MQELDPHISEQFPVPHVTPRTPAYPNARSSRTTNTILVEDIILIIKLISWNSLD